MNNCQQLYAKEELLSILVLRTKAIEIILPNWGLLDVHWRPVTAETEIEAEH